MAALKVNPDNSITLPFPLLAIMVTIILALAGWGNSIRADVADLKTWKENHINEVRDNKTAINEQFKAMSAAMQAKSDKDEKWRSEIQETLTQIRIAVGARPAATPK
ncbi:hypothetical protein MUN82_03865 [Hymenobacter aerilatus]|uniref:Uncharacterized protein n=1 Tax=Hymenobacter aerilatus TaxID=2932251 RepID=A0A8T9SWM4_9BACT|nr:hypothetical protein [Hymenobacter aerilatus]UOR06235.1 hypothetical protein MUN82_03865 [Hymenobacter aerilatus]